MSAVSSFLTHFLPQLVYTGRRINKEICSFDVLAGYWFSGINKSAS